MNGEARSIWGRRGVVAAAAAISVFAIATPSHATTECTLNVRQVWIDQAAATAASAVYIQFKNASGGAQGSMYKTDAQVGDDALNRLHAQGLSAQGASSAAQFANL
ncbi:MAG: hypothetical protein AAGL49_08035 [Pseudomonadota bacterium]